MSNNRDINVFEHSEEWQPDSNENTIADFSTPPRKASIYPRVMTPNHRNFTPNNRSRNPSRRGEMRPSRANPYAPIDVSSPDPTPITSGCVGADGRWHPSEGITLPVELNQDLVDSLAEIGARDGIQSIYQVIRNACYNYVRYRNGKGRDAQFNRPGFQPPSRN